MRSKEKAIILLSGGQDSTTCLYWALERFDQVEAVGFDYGQKHRQELIQAARIAKNALVPYKIFDVRGCMTGSALVNHGEDVSGQHPLNPNLPASFTPGRNAMFLSIAASWAYVRGAKDLVTGVCQTDFSGYPDCRSEFIQAQQKALSLAMEAPFLIHTPLMYLTKAETWKLAKDLGCLEVIIEETLTDYNGDMTRNEWGYGTDDNPATNLRKKGYEEAKAKGWV